MQKILIYPYYKKQITDDWFNESYWKTQNKFLGLAEGGRGSALFFKESGKNFILRHYLRGGKIAKLSKDKYFFLGKNNTRSFKEFNLHCYLYQKGLPVAKPVAAKFVKSGLFYTADYICEKIPDSQTLAKYLKTTNDFMILEDVKNVVAKFHKIGLDHKDLNAYNILISQQKIYLIDFDKCDLKGNKKTFKKNLKRLENSINKIFSSNN